MRIHFGHPVNVTVDIPKFGGIDVGVEKPTEKRLYRIKVLKNGIGLF